ncbi:MAG: hypothetical protein ACEPOZ_11530 [Marinifilaceae bacterium]
MTKKFNENAWYVDLIMSFVSFGLAILFGTMNGYEEYLSRQGNDLPSGKSGKVALLIMKLIDSIGGKSLVVGVFVFLGVLCIWWAYSKYQKKNW